MRQCYYFIQFSIKIQHVNRNTLLKCVDWTVKGTWEGLKRNNYNNLMVEVKQTTNYWKQTSTHKEKRQSRWHIADLCVCFKISTRQNQYGLFFCLNLVHMVLRFHLTRGVENHLTISLHWMFTRIFIDHVCTLLLYTLNWCSKKYCCKQCKHVKFKGTMTKWPVQKESLRTAQKHAEHQAATNIYVLRFYSDFSCFILYLCFL